MGQEIIILILVKMVMMEEVEVVDLPEMDQQDLLVLVIKIIMLIFNHSAIMAGMELPHHHGYLEEVVALEVLEVMLLIRQGVVMEEEEKTLYHILEQM